MHAGGCSLYGWIWIVGFGLWGKEKAATRLLKKAAKRRERGGPLWLEV